MAHLIVANWKMYLSYNQVLMILKNTDFSTFTNHELVLCPSFDSLSHAKQLLQKSSLKLGAQDCSSYKTGAYTGQVSAKSLKEIGCTHCIVGHSETRRFFKLTNDDVANKIAQLVAEDIIPIICIGETDEEYAQQKTIKILENQLKPVLAVLQNRPAQLCIAYEPIWSIGTNVIPTNEHLQMVYQHLDKLFDRHIKQGYEIRLLYGGSVDSKSIQTVKLVPLIQGFLIGRASTDFQELKNIVLSI